MIFGNWRPGGLVARRRPVRLHGLAAVARSTRPAHALLLVRRPSLFVVLALRALLRRRWVVAGDRRSRSPPACCRLVPDHRRRSRREIIPFLPHVTTLLVLVFAAQRLRPPAADGRDLPAESARVSGSTAPTIDWDAAARRRRARSCRRGRTRRTRDVTVGAAALVDDGRVVARLQRRERVVRPDAVRRVRPGRRPCRHRRRAAGGAGRSSAATARTSPRAVAAARCCTSSAAPTCWSTPAADRRPPTALGELLPGAVRPGRPRARSD